MLLSWVDRKGFVINYLRSQNDGNAKLLDFGCGNGLFLKYAEDYFETVGIDYSVDAISLAKQNTKKTSYLKGSIDALKSSKRKVDVLTCFDVLEHIEKNEHDKYLREFKKKLKNGGLLVISVPNYDSWMRTLQGKYWWAFEDESHVSLKGRKYWLTLLEANGLVVEKIFSSGYINHPLEKYAVRGWKRLVQASVQLIGMSGIFLPTFLSDVDFFVCRKYI